ncbi:M28 family peptidase [Gemmatimonas sp.]|uniref:M28 family peptidase n=1 Tax=Gemmatimonas sp. TaxID=1962908 RepID=UPI0039835E5B
MRRYTTCAAVITTLVVSPTLLAGQQPAEAWWRHVQVLAHDSLKGRDTGSPGHEAAARYVAEQFKLAGLTPAGTDGWYQPVRFIEVALAKDGVTLALREGDAWNPLAVGRDLRVTARLSTDNVEAPLVFAGYGITLPQAGIDDLKGLDLRGKIVVYVNANPKGLSAPLLAHGTRTRWAAMRQAGAVGVVAVGAGGSWVDNENTRLGSSVSLADTSLDDLGGQRINSVLNPALMPRLLAGSGIVWDSIVAVAARGEPLPTAELTVALRATLPTLRRDILSPNVVGMLPGTDPTLRDEVVVLSAHLDHVGTFKGPALTGDSIFNGAMDNATGAATLLETAKTVSARGGNKRTVLFVAVTAEEKGLLGSRYFAARPSLTRGTIVANLNTDMFLPLFPLKGLFVYGNDESDLADDVDGVVTARGLRVLPDPEPQEMRFVRSDQYSFIRRGVPSLAFKLGYTSGTADEKTFTGWVRERYHKMSDDLAQPIDFEAAAGFNALYADLALGVANRKTRPTWRPNSFFATPVIVP